MNPDSIEQRMEIELATESKRILNNEFLEPLPELLKTELPSTTGEPFRLGDIVQKGIDAIQASKTDVEKIEQQKTFLIQLVDSIKNLPSDSWSCSNRQLQENKSTNCSGASSLLASILEVYQDAIGIKKFDVTNPRSHSINIITLADENLYYADPRNGVFEDVTQRMSVEEYPGMRLYVLRDPEPKMPHQFYPTLENRNDLMVAMYAGNMAEILDFSRGEFHAMRDIATPDELLSMQKEAQAAQQWEHITNETTATHKELARRFMAPIENFRQTERFKSEAEVMKTGNDAQDALNRIGSRMQQDSKLLKRLIDAKPNIRAFLLDESSELELGDEKIEADLHLYRDAQKTNHTISHKSEEDIALEVDQLLKKL